MTIISQLKQEENTVWYYYINSHIDHWNRIVFLRIELHIYDQLIFDKDAQVIQWGN